MAKSLDGLHPTLMRPRVEALLADPDAEALRLYVVSAFRSVERQRELFQAAVKKYGSEAAARKWVAPPGKSNHGPKVDGYGTAVDLGIPGRAAIGGQWPGDLERQVNEIAARHGLYSPMEWEDWHFEPIKNWTAPKEELTMDDEAKHAFAALDGRLDVITDAVSKIAGEVTILRAAVKGVADDANGMSWLGERVAEIKADLDAVKEAHGITD